MSRFTQTYLVKELLYRVEIKSLVKPVVWMLQSLFAVQLDSQAQELIHTLQHKAEHFPIDKLHCMCVLKLIPWAKQRFGSPVPILQAWFQFVHEWLVAETKNEPRPYTDWARPDNSPCVCPLCKELNRFLADPNQSNYPLMTVEEGRQHLIDKITTCQLDLSHQVVKFKRPYILQLTKTEKSLQRNLMRHEKLLAILSELDQLEVL